MMFKSSVATVVLALSMAATPLYAHHHEEGAKTGEELFDRTLELNNTVTDSSISFAIKQNVYRFADDAFAYANCVTVASVEEQDGDVDDGSNHHHEGAGDCAALSARAHASWRLVDTSLSTSRDAYPRVYDAYLAAKGALAELD